MRVLTVITLLMVGIVSLATMVSEITSLSLPESNIAKVIKAWLVFVLTIFTGTIGLITSSAALTLFVTAVAPSHMTKFPSPVTSAVLAEVVGNRG